ncbi:MAG TPA: putative LPS assembly protein LptD, partial [Gemmatimonadales bacterium]
ALGAQPPVRTTRRPPTDTARAPGDTIPRDSAAADSAAADSAQRPLVDWAEPDSVLQSLLGLQGFATTRYQGEDVTFLVGTRRIVLTGDPAAVQQGEAVVVGDTIVYDDSTGQIEVRGGSNGLVTLRDPAQGQDDIRATWIRYNVRTGQGTVGNVATAVQSGETWHVSAERAGIFGARDGEGTTRFYGHDGTVTSCDLEEPHYHFEARNLKVVRGRIMVARPAVLYIGEVPVLWLPFVFQDMRSGRRSGFLAPRFGVAELVRNSPSYRRSVDNLGYYFAISDYADARVWLDWRSGARGDDRDPGYWRYNGEVGYNWLDWFVRGRLAAGYETWQGGRKNLTLSLQHSQQFSQRTSLNANVNYAQSTQLQRLGAYTPQAALATIQSQANFQTRRGPFSLNLGASRTQYTGQDKVDQTFPTLNVTAEPISLGEWLTWTPSFRLQNRQSLNYTDAGMLGTRFSVVDGRVVADTGRYDQRETTIDLQTPLKIFDFNWSNSISVAETERDAPSRSVVYGATPGDSSVRIFARSFETEVRWNTSFSLPSFSPGRWNLTPSVNLSDVEGSAGFLVRSHLSGGEWVRQNKRPSFSVSTAPTFFRRYGGIGPFEALRHQVSPSLSFNYAPEGRVSDEFLLAIGQNPGSYIGALRQAALSFNLNTTIEAKMRRRGPAGDSAAADSARRAGAEAGSGAAGETVKLLALRFSPLSYDFVRADTLGRGLTSESFSVDADTDLLPGFNARADWSLFTGPSSDIRSEFKPYLTGINASFSLNQNSNALALLSRVFGRSVPLERPGETVFDPTAGDTLAAELARQPVAGSRARTPVEQIPQGQGWRASLNFSMRRSRPADQLLGTVIEFDPELECSPFRRDPLLFDDCVLRVSRNPPAQEQSTLPGATITRFPTQTSLGSQMSFDLTPNWTGSWQTSYDFTRSEFADHVVSLQRNLHDWRAVFAFTQSPNGNFAFSFFIALKAQPDLKFDYDQRSYRGQSGR